MLLLNLIQDILPFIAGDFNTSYVVIKHTRCLQTAGIRRISIHLMLLLNYLVIEFSIFHKHISIHLMLLLNNFFHFLEYRYIKISIHLMLLLNLTILETGLYVVCYFNTSYVVIKPEQTMKKKRSYLYFNTSYVVIKQERW